MDNTQSTQSTDEPLWEAGDLAERWKLSVSQIYSMARDTDPATGIPCIRFGRIVRFVPSVIREIERQRNLNGGQAS